MGAEELARLVVRLIGDASSYLSMLSQVEIGTKQITSTVSTMVSKLGSIQTALKGVASKALGFLGQFGLSGSFTGIFNNFMVMQDLTTGLSAAITANGGVVDDVMPKYEEFAKKIMAITTMTKVGTLSLLQMIEAQGFSGDSATQIATNAIALAKGNEELAQSYVRVAVMMQRGHPEFARRILGLQGVKNGTELLTTIQKRLQANMDIGIAKTANFSGEITKLKRTFWAINAEMGKSIAEIIGPFIHALTLASEYIKNLTPETKKTIAQVVLWTLAFLALAPTISAISYFLGPVITLLSALASAIIFVVTSPVALFILGIAAMVAGMLYLTGQGAELISWFGKQWDGLVEDVKIAMGGIADALKAGDIELAWKIIWTSVKLVWAKSTQDIREMYVGFLVWFKESSIEAGTAIESLWHKSTDAIAKFMINTQEMLGQVTSAQADQLRKNVSAITAEDLKDLAQFKTKMMQKIGDEGRAETKRIQDEIKGLTKERDGLVKEAREKARDVKLPEFKVPKLPPMKQDIKLIPKFDAAAFASAEAVSRIQAFKDKLDIQLSQKEGDLPGAMKKFDAAEFGGAEARSRNEGAETILKEIRDILKGDSKKPGIPLVPAGLR